MNKTLLPANIQPTILIHEDSVNPNDWFFVKGQYDGFEQIWILEKSEHNRYHTRSVFHEDSRSNGYYEGQFFDKVFYSLSEACCRIPGTAYPLFEGVSLPEEEPSSIQDFRLLSTNTYNATFYNSAKNKNDSVKCLGVVTHKTYSKIKDSYHEFKYNEYLNDVQEWFGLTHSEKEKLEDSYIARKCPLGFALEFDNDLFTRNSDSRDELRKIFRLRQKISDKVQSLT